MLALYTFPVKFKRCITLHTLTEVSQCNMIEHIVITNGTDTRESLKIKITYLISVAVLCGYIYVELSWLSVNITDVISISMFKKHIRRENINIL